MNFDLPQEKSSIIKVLGVGGGGSNAVNFMFEQGIKDVDFIVCNTDAQALIKSPVPIKIQLGASLTQGRGAGSKPEQGRQAAIENLDDVMSVLKDDTKMVFITAGMGGGTGTGAAPILAKAAKELGILTVAIVTIPFRFEGPKRINHAVEGISLLREHVDSLLVINNERLREIYGDLPVSDAWARADNILSVAAKGIAEIITVAGHINVDFADVETVMTNSGVAIMGQGEGEGENRAIDAIESALTSPLLNNNDIKGARNILLNIISGKKEVTMDEIAKISEYAQNAAGNYADIILGSCFNENMDEKVGVTIIATGFDISSIPELHARQEQKKNFVNQMSENKNYSNQNSFIERRTTQKTINFSDQKEDTKLKDEISKLYDNKKNNNDSNNQNDSTKIYRFADLQNPENIDDLENVPAYKRADLVKEIEKDINYSKESDYSKYSLEDDNKSVKIKENNSYLSNNVD